ncbi:MAG TPA: helix-turn-helix domain-containing protein [Paucimonas sp.]|nr:helix-turn-helix domain-containing protein [Paucimonas sp.]
MLTLSLPSAPLRDFVSHYWLSLDNPDPRCAISPDGAIDLVVELNGASVSSRVYGTATAHSDIPLGRGSHYLGIRFRPGQSRHFLDAAPYELTDACVDAPGLLSFGLEDVPEGIGRSDVFARLDKILQRHVAAKRPARADIDDVISLIVAGRGMLRIEDAAAAFGRSRRQLERVFLETVGVSPKFFSRITRFRRACALIARPPAALAALADIALEAGYADQSHMNHEFLDFANTTPASFMRHRVAFLQEPSFAVPDNMDFPHSCEETSHEDLVRRHH